MEDPTRDLLMVHCFCLCRCESLLGARSVEHLMLGFLWACCDVLLYFIGAFYLCLSYLYSVSMFSVLLFWFCQYWLLNDDFALSLLAKWLSRKTLVSCESRRLSPQRRRWRVCTCVCLCCYVFVPGPTWRISNVCGKMLPIYADRAIKHQPTSQHLIILWQLSLLLCRCEYCVILWILRYQSRFTYSWNW